MLSPTGSQAEGATLPASRGPLSRSVLALLQGEPYDAPEPASTDPYGDDLHLALHCCYELHYRGFAEVDPDLEWDPSLLSVRREMEQIFLQKLRRDTEPGTDVASEIDALLVEPVDGAGVSHHLRRDGQLWQLREYIAHRSIYHLKEADPQAWVIPRLSGAPKAALVTIEHDEYGGGDPDRMHANLFATMMSELELDERYGSYVDMVPAATLAEVNFMSLCGLHRGLRGALLGQFAVVELTSSPGSDRLVRAMRRLGCGPAAIEFYAEHIEADAVHEQLIRRGVLDPLLTAEPDIAADVVFGIRASTLLGDRLSEMMLSCWRHGLTSLRRPLPATTGVA